MIRISTVLLESYAACIALNIVFVALFSAVTADDTTCAFLNAIPTYLTAVLVHRDWAISPGGDVMSAQPVLHPFTHTEFPITSP
jgi:hypothetical protein